MKSPHVRSVWPLAFRCLSASHSELLLSIWRFDLDSHNGIKYDAWLVRMLSYLLLESWTIWPSVIVSHHETFCQSLQVFPSSDPVTALLTSTATACGDLSRQTVFDFAGHVQKRQQIRSDSHARPSRPLAVPGYAPFSGQQTVLARLRPQSFQLYAAFAVVNFSV